MTPKELVLRVGGYAGGLSTVTLLVWAAGWTANQILATTIFLGFILGTLLFWRFRLGFAMVGVLGLLATGVLDVPHLIEFASLDVILFLIGMMMIIAFLEKRRFFEVMVERILRRVDRRAWHLLTAFMVMGAVSAAQVDEVTSILFMTAVGLQLTRRFKLDPVPIVIMLVFATNIGSSATVVGNPIGVMIALRAGLTFTDFLRTATPIASGVLLLAIPLSFLAFPGAVRSLALALLEHRERVPIPIERMSRRDFRISMLVFGVTILGNLTLIGSTANIVALGILERDEKIHMSFLRWLRPGLIVAVPTLALATLVLWLVP